MRGYINHRLHIKAGVGLADPDRAAGTALVNRRRVRATVERKSRLPWTEANALPRMFGRWWRAAARGRRTSDGVVATVDTSTAP